MKLKNIKYKRWDWRFALFPTRVLNSEEKASNFDTARKVWGELIWLERYYIRRNNLKRYSKEFRDEE